MNDQICLILRPQVSYKSNIEIINKSN